MSLRQIVTINIRQRMPTKRAVGACRVCAIYINPFTAVDVYTRVKHVNNVKSTTPQDACVLHINK